MAVKYTVVARGNPQDAAAPKKYYPQIKSTGKLTIRDLASQAAEISTFSSVDMVAAIEAFLTIIPGALAAGNIVNLGDFGTFSLRIRSEGSDTEEAVTARKITKTLMSFRPGKRFKAILDAIVYEKL
jgi:predicted histone-like DNA-binding protein